MREATKNDYTQEEIKNLENGKCWCGKPRAEFDKGMKVYCSKPHYRDWYARTIPWSHFKEEFLDENGKICKKCGCTPDSLKKDGKQSYSDWLVLIKKNPEVRKLMEIIRIKELNELEERYQKIIDDDYLIKHNLTHNWSELPDGIPKAPEEDNWTHDRFDVDHIIAISLGGEMWDKKNLQVLCNKCHKIKTSEDMKKLKAKRRGLKRFDEVEIET